VIRSDSVFVIGGGPAGLAAAIAASQKGFRVTVADGSKPPIDKACGEGLMPATLEALEKLGITFSGTEGRSFPGVRFLDGPLTAEAKFPDGHAIGMRRTILHQKMVERAAECGVSFLWGTSITGISPRGVVADGFEHSSDWIVGADGSGSRVRKWSGLDERSRDNRRFAFRRHFRVEPWTDFMEVYWGSDMQAYVTPLGPEEICVAVISYDPGTRLEVIARQFPELAERLRDAVPTSAERGAITGMKKLRCVFRGNVALVGDASGGIDAITGEGLCLGFQQAAKFAESLERNDLVSYQSEHSRIARRPWMFAQLMLLLGAYPILRRHVIRALSIDSTIFARLLSMHIGPSSFPNFASTGTRFGRKLLESVCQEGFE
jgi:2-polyprenyl-6-methoxyphenol hydroxylase-like FAD-dependent oxidoreductase